MLELQLVSPGLAGFEEIFSASCFALKMHHFCGINGLKDFPLEIIALSARPK